MNVGKMKAILAKYPDETPILLHDAVSDQLGEYDAPPLTLKSRNIIEDVAKFVWLNGWLAEVTELEDEQIYKHYPEKWRHLITIEPHKKFLMIDGSSNSTDYITPDTLVLASSNPEEEKRTPYRIGDDKDAYNKEKSKSWYVR